MTKYHQGRYSLINPQKYKGDPTKVYFRSSWERRFMLYCDRNDSILEWGSEEIVIPYRSPLDGRIHRYYPDFYVKARQHDGTTKKMIIEVKPKSQTMPPTSKPKRKTKSWYNSIKEWGKNSAKWESAREYCADRDIEFKILTEDHLLPKHK